MNGLTFTVELVKELAWPATVLTIALAFRARISELLQVLKKGNFESWPSAFLRGVCRASSR